MTKANDASLALNDDQRFLKALRNNKMKTMRVIGRGLVSMSAAEARKSEQHKKMLAHAKKIRERQESQTA